MFEPVWARQRFLVRAQIGDWFIWRKWVRHRRRRGRWSRSLLFRIEWGRCNSTRRSWLRRRCSLLTVKFSQPWQWRQRQYFQIWCLSCMCARHRRSRGFRCRKIRVCRTRRSTRYTQHLFTWRRWTVRPWWVRHSFRWRLSWWIVRWDRAQWWHIQQFFDFSRRSLGWCARFRRFRAAKRKNAAHEALSRLCFSLAGHVLVLLRVRIFGQENRFPGCLWFRQSMQYDWAWNRQFFRRFQIIQGPGCISHRTGCTISTRFGRQWFGWRIFLHFDMFFFEGCKRGPNWFVRRCAIRWFRCRFCHISWVRHIGHYDGEWLPIILFGFQRFEQCHGFRTIARIDEFSFLWPQCTRCWLWIIRLNGRSWTLRLWWRVSVNVMRIFQWLFLHCWFICGRSGFLRFGHCDGFRSGCQRCDNLAHFQIPTCLW